MFEAFRKILPKATGTVCVRRVFAIVLNEEKKCKFLVNHKALYNIYYLKTFVLQIMMI
jgi:hypothetical protein